MYADIRRLLKHRVTRRLIKEDIPVQGMQVSSILTRGKRVDGYFYFLSS